MLIWTRSREDWAEDQRLFQGYKKKYLHMPCLRTNPIPFELGMPEKPFFLAFTSSKGSEYFLKSKEGLLALQKAKSIYALGKASADPLLSAQFNVEVAHSKNGRDFEDWLLDRSQVDDLFVLPGARDRAYDLAQGLQSAGRSATKVDIYNTLAAATTSLGASVGEDVILEISVGSVVCFASPSAVDGFSKAVSKRSQIIAICIGETTAARALGFKRVYSAPEPTVETLFAEALKHVTD
ncbi:MAG: uroporphyrinogen-III synthase [Pseudomonadota bacterium]